MNEDDLIHSWPRNGHAQSHLHGLTKREYFTGLVFRSLVNNIATYNNGVVTPETSLKIANDAVMLTNALFIAVNKK